MKLEAATRILAVAGICAASLIAIVVSEGLAREGGQEITLPMEAVDPRSILSGHYVQLNFTQRLEASDVCPQNGDWDWVALRPEQARAATRTVDEIEAGGHEGYGERWRKREAGEA